MSAKLPKDWKVGMAFRSCDHETTARLLAETEGKAAQRVATGLVDYRIRFGSVERRRVGGRPALSCVGEFTRGDMTMARNPAPTGVPHSWRVVS